MPHSQDLRDEELEDPSGRAKPRGWQGTNTSSLQCLTLWHWFDPAAIIAMLSASVCITVPGRACRSHMQLPVMPTVSAANQLLPAAVVVSADWCEPHILARLNTMVV